MAVTGDATVNDAIVSSGGHQRYSDCGEMWILPRLRAGTTITVSGQDIDLAGKVDATTTAMLTAHHGERVFDGGLSRLRAPP